MAKTWTNGRHYLTGHGALMLCLGLATCTLASLMTSSTFAKLGYAIALALSATCLLVVGIYLGARMVAERSHYPIMNYLIVGVMSIACWLLFWLLGSAPTDLRLLTLLGGMHGVVWTLWYVRLAFNMKAFPRKAAFLSILAATTSFLGIALATESELTQLSAASIAAYYTLVIGIEILVTTVYLYREFEMEAVSPQRIPVRSEVSIHRDPRKHKRHGIFARPGPKEKPARITAN